MDEDDDMLDYFPANPDEEELTLMTDLNFDEENVIDVAASVVVEEPVLPEPVAAPVPTILADVVVPLVTLPESNEEFVSVKGSSATTVYLRKRVSVPVVWEAVESSSFATLLAESIESTRLRDAELVSWMAESRLPGRDGQQFIDKYRPSRFIDLLSDDSINRQVMMWLAEWKKNLHTTNPSSTISPPAPVAAAPAPVEPPAPRHGMDRPTGKWVKPEQPELQFAKLPPMANKKILLLGGSPGVGKSTLIEICAKHFHYALIESSSADERGKTAMGKVITDVCSNRSVLDATKPQLLLIEEVDGDECTAAELLVDLVHKHPELIKRPIICVCSDVWNKRLRSLREVSTALTLPPPRSLRLAEKLKQICTNENILIESMAIDRLVSLCECDVRACLNQLQTLAARKNTSLSVADVMKYCSGASDFGQAALKDTQKSELEILGLIFEPKRSRPTKYFELMNSAIHSAKNLSANLSELFAHCLVTVPFTDFNFRYMTKLVELISFENSCSHCFGIAMKFAANFCPAVGKPRIDIAGARKLVSARYHANFERQTVINSLGKSAIHSVAASRFIMNSFGQYAARLLLTILEPEHNSVWVKKAATVHPDVTRIAKIYAQFGLQLCIPDDFVESSEKQLLQLVPDLHVFAKGGYLVGSPMGELLRTEAQSELLKMRAANEGSAELVAKGKRAIVQEAEAIKKSARLNLSSWAGKTSAHHTDGSDVIIVKKFPFEFRFNEGHTNAVRRVLRLKDFRPPI